MLEGKLLPMLYVHDLVRSVEFYRDVLGFEFAGWWDESKGSFVTDPPADTPPGFAELIAGDLVLHLHRAGPEMEIGSGGVLHLRVKDADAYHAEMKRRGGHLEPPKDQPWGWRQFYAEDPDGHRWSFSHLL